MVVVHWKTSKSHVSISSGLFTLCGCPVPDDKDTTYFKSGEFSCLRCQRVQRSREITARDIDRDRERIQKKKRTG